MREHMALALRVARRQYANMPSWADRDGLNGAALEALAEAHCTFDESRGVPFEAWVAIKVRWAVIDELRTTLGETETHQIVNRERLQSDEFWQSYDQEDTDTYPDIEDRLWAQQLYAEILPTLPPRPRLMLVFRWIYGWPLAAIGEAFGITESAVCIAEKRSVARIREQVAA